ncbi:MAG: LysR family transcriptional regulator [Proteobacteria bacterium]|nr:LysR family transcriptional regulator [Pseudomonadota bacterium]
MEIMKICFRIWLDNDGRAFGEGSYRLLKAIQRTGSLNHASTEMGMSYRKAWDVLNVTEKRLGFELVERKTGGKSGGGTALTSEGRAFVNQYEQLRQEASEALDSLYHKYFPEPETDATGASKKDPDEVTTFAE